MKRILTILLTLATIAVYGQIQPSPPTGSKAYGTTTYIAPDGMLWYGTNPLKYRGVYPKTKIDSLLALIAPFDASLYYTKVASDARFYPLSTNPAGYLTSFTEVDPTVPAYAKSLSAFSVIKTSTDALYPTQTGGNASGTWNINVLGNASTVTNGVYSTGSYANPSWITSLAYSKLTGAPTALSQFTNDLGNYGNWITKAQGDTYYYPLSGNPSGFLTSADLSGYELLANKQNTLTTDGTGVKYPTVDATIAGLELKINVSQIASQTKNAVSIAYWGDSMTQGTGSTSGNDYPSVLSGLYGTFKYNGGVGGETSTQIKNRMVDSVQYHNWPTIIWVGHNNYADTTTVKNDIAEMVSALGHDNYIIMSVLNGDYPSMWSGGSDYAIIMSLNSSLQATYGAKYVDVRAYLVSQYNPLIPQDVIDHGHDIPPSSLRSDNLHLNNNGYKAVADKLLENIQVLNTSDSVITAKNIIPTFSSPPGIGLVNRNQAKFTYLDVENVATIRGGIRANSAGGLSSYLSLQDNGVDLGYFTSDKVLNNTYPVEDVSLVIPGYGRLSFYTNNLIRGEFTKDGDFNVISNIRGGSLISDDIKALTTGDLSISTNPVASGNILFKTNGTERARFDWLGNFAIGTTSHSAKMDVYTNTDAWGISTGNNAGYNLKISGTASNGSGGTTALMQGLNNGVVSKLAINGNGGFVSIGKIIPDVQLDVNGTIRASNAPVDSTDVVRLTDLSSYVNTTGNQTGIVGTKEWLGDQTLASDVTLYTTGSEGSSANIWRGKFHSEGTSSKALTIGYDGITMNTAGSGHYSAILKSDDILSNNKTFQFPNASGTLALTSDIPVVASGTYTPTMTASTNISLVTEYPCYYTRINNLVTVTGSLTFQCTTAGGTQSFFYVTLPISSDLTGIRDLSGMFNGQSAGQGIITGDTTNNRAFFQINTQSAVTQSALFTFTYEIK